jgi:hypothetical protein
MQYRFKTNIIHAVQAERDYSSAPLQKPGNTPTVPKSLWVHQEGLAPIFVGGPEVIWGLSGYILERLALDILLPNSNQKAPGDDMLMDETPATSRPE